MKKYPHFPKKRGVVDTFSANKRIAKRYFDILIALQPKSCRIIGPLSLKTHAKLSFKPPFPIDTDKKYPQSPFFETFMDTLDLPRDFGICAIAFSNSADNCNEEPDAKQPTSSMLWQPSASLYLKTICNIAIPRLWLFMFTVRALLLQLRSSNWILKQRCP